jgi:translation elongation factor EF-1alpha
MGYEKLDVKIVVVGHVDSEKSTEEPNKAVAVEENQADEINVI